MPSLRELLPGQADSTEFADTEPIKALQGILDNHPEIIVLERRFAATPRGIALVNRIKGDPELVKCDLRVMSHKGDYVQYLTRRPGDPPPPATKPTSTTEGPPGPAPQLDWRGTRRKPRPRLRSGVEIQLDGVPCAVVDLSPLGVQVVSTAIIKPNQKVRVTIPDGKATLRFRGTVIWAKFELPKPTLPPVYRAGVEFIDADTPALTDYCARSRQ
jgi:hypothetical protein